MSRRAAAALAAAVLCLAGCGSGAALSAADPKQSVAPGSLPAGVSLQSDAPVCTEAGDSQLCQIGVWYVNGTDSDITLDATTTDFRDGAGQRHAGITGVTASEVPVPALGRAKVLWSVKLPYGTVPAEVRWAAPDGSVAAYAFGGASPSASASVPQTGSESPTPTPTPTPTSATPKPTPTKASPSPRSTTSSARPRPTRTTSTPAPQPPPPVSTPTTPGGAIG